MRPSNVDVEFFGRTCRTIGNAEGISNGLYCHAATILLEYIACVLFPELPVCWLTLVFNPSNLIYDCVSWKYQNGSRMMLI